MRESVFRIQRLPGLHLPVYGELRGCLCQHVTNREAFAQPYSCQNLNSFCDTDPILNPIPYKGLWSREKEALEALGWV